MTEVFLTRGRSLEQLSTPTFSTNGTWAGGVWDGQKWDSIEGYAVSNVSTAVVVHQAQISGQWDISETFRINGAGRSAALVTHIDTSLKGQYARLTASTASGITPSSGFFRIASWGKAAGQTEVDISGQTITAWISGAITVLQSGTPSVSLGAAALNISGAVTVLQSGTPNVSLNSEAVNISGAPTVLVSGPLVVKVSGETIVTNPTSLIAKGHLSIAVTSGSTLILSGNANRKVAVIQNDSDTPMYLAFSGAAVINTAMRINAAGGSLIISKMADLFTTDAIYGVHNESGNKIAVATEFE